MNVDFFHLVESEQRICSAADSRFELNLDIIGLAITGACRFGQWPLR